MESLHEVYEPEDEEAENEETRHFVTTKTKAVEDQVAEATTLKQKKPEETL